MQILTYPIGILVGMLSVSIDLGSSAPPAELRLDGKTVCQLTEKRATCAVDLGTTPHLHLLEAVRLDAAGKVVDRATRAVNAPGETGAEARFFPECSPATKSCDVKFGWIHPEKKPIVSAHLSVDGVEVPMPKDGRLQVPYDQNRGHVVSLELDFGHDDRLSVSDVVGPRHAEASATLRAYPVVTDAEPADLEKNLHERGVPIQTVERGQAEALFVVEQTAFGQIDSIAGKRTDFFSQRLSTADVVSVVPANHPVGSPFPRYRAVGEGSTIRLDGAAGGMEASKPSASSRSATVSGASNIVQREKTDWLATALVLLRGHGRAVPRATEAAAASGLALGGAPRRRALVLVLGDEKDESKLTPEAVRAYLTEIGVPLVVWRTQGARTGWPEAVPVTSAGELARALSDVRTLLTRQVVVWAPPETTLAMLNAK